MRHLWYALILVVLVTACPKDQPPATADRPAPEPLAAGVSRPVVTLATTMGVITIELDRQKAPLCVENFLSYVASGHYDGTVFHRVIRDFMIQGGGFTSDMSQKPTRPPIRNEATNGLSNVRGTLAMARTNVVDSATSQFFINVVDNPNLDYQGPDQYGYAVFGRVKDGMDVVDAIRAVPTHGVGGHRDVPVTPVVIEKATVVAQ
ncbi:peptidyl-prolyl cis-trans isomerase [Candidatus Fermentibacteria bacterium]|nr:peptidyl-prolyl cis-trans isomerase [Candidatus Fermentibacteria bacterium]